MDCFNDVLTTFLGLERGSCNVGSESESSQIQKYLNLCLKDEQRSYGFKTALGWVINFIIVIFGCKNLFNFNIVNEDGF